MPSSPWGLREIGRCVMSRLVALAIVVAIALMASSGGSLAVQGDPAQGKPCPAAGAATPSPGASPTASPTATHEASPEASPRGPGCTVDIHDFGFHPDQIEITAGTTVTWTNTDTVPHTVTATDRSFDSSILDPAANFSHTFDKPGTYTYACMIHPSMKGTVILH